MIGDPVEDAINSWKVGGKSCISQLFHLQIASFSFCLSCGVSNGLYPISDVLSIPLSQKDGATIEVSHSQCIFVSFSL